MRLWDWIFQDFWKHPPTRNAEEGAEEEGQEAPPRHEAMRLWDWIFQDFWNHPPTRNNAGEGAEEEGQEEPPGH